MKIVGVGCGPGLLTEEATEVIRSATLIVGSDRAIALVRHEIARSTEVRVITDYQALRHLPDEAVILSTGDPLVSGLGYLPGEIIPGISSVQSGAARLHIPLTKLVTLTAHGRGDQEAVEMAGDLVEDGFSVCLITDPAFRITSLTRRLAAFPAIRLAVCQDIGYPEEKILTGTVSNPPEPTSGMYILFILHGT